MDFLVSVHMGILPGSYYTVFSPFILKQKSQWKFKVRKSRVKTKRKTSKDNNSQIMHLVLIHSLFLKKWNLRFALPTTSKIACIAGAGYLF